MALVQCRTRHHRHRSARCRCHMCRGVSGREGAKADRDNGKCAKSCCAVTRRRNRSTAKNARGRDGDGVSQVRGGTGIDPVFN